MRLFALRDSNDADSGVLAVLACYESAGEFYIDMPPGADPWGVPLVLSSFAARGKWEIGPEWAGRWVASRLVPRSRQNLGEVLRDSGLDRYDELRLLELTEGRSSQDDCYLEPLGPADVPAWFAEREQGRVADAVPLAGFRLLVAFRSGQAVVCEGRGLEQFEPGISPVLGDESTFARAVASAGGRGVRWGTVVRVGAEALRATGRPCGLAWGDLARIAPALLVDASGAAAELGCTRQNVNALVKRGVLSPVLSTGKATLFLRADIRARRDGM